MQFLSNVYSECPSCRGRRYNRETLDILYKGYSISDVLNMSVNEALTVFEKHPKISQKLRTLSEVGLGYLSLGQSSTTFFVEVHEESITIENISRIVFFIITIKTVY